jgi:hypothetical protein
MCLLQHLTLRVTSRSGSSDSGAEMALLVPNWNPSDNYTGPLRMLSWLFWVSSVSSHSARPRAVTKCQAEKALIGDRTSRVKCPIFWSLEPPVAEMPKWPGARSFGISRFTKYGCKGYPCTLGSPVAEKPKYPTPILSGFRGSRKQDAQGCPCSLEPLSPKSRNDPALAPFWDFTFREIWMQGMSLLLGVSGHRKAEMTRRLFLFGILHFVKSRYKECPCSLEFLVAEKPK